MFNIGEQLIDLLSIIERCCNDLWSWDSNHRLLSGVDVAEAMAEPVKSQSVDFVEPRRILSNSRAALHARHASRVVEPDDHQFFMELHKEIGRSPDFYKNAPVVIDVGPIAERKPTNLAEFARRLAPAAIGAGRHSKRQRRLEPGRDQCRPRDCFPAGKSASAAQKPPVNGERPAAAEAPAFGACRYSR